MNVYKFNLLTIFLEKKNNNFTLGDSMGSVLGFDALCRSGEKQDNEQGNDNYIGKFRISSCFF